MELGRDWTMKEFIHVLIYDVQVPSLIPYGLILIYNV